MLKEEEVLRVCKGYVKVTLRNGWQMIKIPKAVLNFSYVKEERKMGVVQFIILGLVFVALAGCFVYSIIANKQK